MDELTTAVALLLLLVALVVTLLALLIYSGLFSSIEVKVSKPPIGKALVAYKNGTGPYKNCGAVFSESCSIAPDRKQIGFYYDDPEKVKPEKIRWAVGSILAEDSEEPDTELKKAYEKEGYKFIELPSIPACVTATFPHTTMISIIIAVFRVYPVLHDFMTTQGLKAHPCMEVYFGGKIFFMVPLSEYEKFYTVELETQKSTHGQDLSDDRITEGTAGAHETEPRDADDGSISDQSSDESFVKVESASDQEP